MSGFCKKTADRVVGEQEQCINTQWTPFSPLAMMYDQLQRVKTEQLQLENIRIMNMQPQYVLTRIQQDEHHHDIERFQFPQTFQMKQRARMATLRALGRYQNSAAKLQELDLQIQRIYERIEQIANCQNLTKEFKVAQIQQYKLDTFDICTQISTFARSLEENKISEQLPTIEGRLEEHWQLISAYANNLKAYQKIRMVKDTLGDCHFLAAQLAFFKGALLGMGKKSGVFANVHNFEACLGLLRQQFAKLYIRHYEKWHQQNLLMEKKAMLDTAVIATKEHLNKMSQYENTTEHSKYATALVNHIHTLENVKNQIMSTLHSTVKTTMNGYKKRRFLLSQTWAHQQTENEGAV